MDGLADRRDLPGDVAVCDWAALGRRIACAAAMATAAHLAEQGKPAGGEPAALAARNASLGGWDPEPETTASRDG